MYCCELSFTASLHEELGSRKDVSRILGSPKFHPTVQLRIQNPPMDPTTLAASALIPAMPAWGSFHIWMQSPSGPDMADDSALPEGSAPKWRPSHSLGSAPMGSMRHWQLCSRPYSSSTSTQPLDQRDPTPHQQSPNSMRKRRSMLTRARFN